MPAGRTSRESNWQKRILLYIISMKKDIHPKYNTNAKVSCTCGNHFEVGSTLDDIHVEICSNCHPFFTGTQKLVDTARRVEKFEAKKAKTAIESKTRKGKKVKQTLRRAQRKAKEQKVRIDRQPATKTKKKNEKNISDKK